MVNRSFSNDSFFSYFNRQWHTAQKDFQDLLEVEIPKNPVKPEKVGSRLDMKHTDFMKFIIFNHRIRY